MTAKSSGNGIRPRARRLFSRLAAVFVVGAVVGGAAILSTPVPATAADTGSESTDAKTVELLVATDGNSRVAPGGPLVNSVVVTNRTEHALSAGNVTLQLGTAPLADAAALDAWLDSGAYSGELVDVATEPVPEVPAGQRSEVTSVADATVLSNIAPGVYPVQAKLAGARTDDADQSSWDLTSTSVVVVSADAAPAVTVLVPITATPENGALLSDKELTALTAPDGALTGQLDAVAGTNAVIGIDPAILASIRVLGTRAPQSAIAWLQRMEALPNTTFALQFGDADPAAQSQASLGALLTAPTLTPLLNAEDFPLPQPNATPSPSGSPAPSPGSTLPDDAALTSVPGATPSLLWPRGNVTTTDLALFDRYLGTGATTILPSTSLGNAASGKVDVEGHRVLVTDAAASTRFSAAVALSDPVAIDRELGAAAGHLALGPSTGSVLVGLDRSESRSPVALRMLLSAFGGASGQNAVLSAAPSGTATLTTTPTSDRPEALTKMLADEQKLQSFASILDVPAVLTSPERIRLLRSIGVGLDDEQFVTAFTERNRSVQRTLDSVSIQRPKPVQLITSAAPLPVWVRNDLPWPVNVTLHGRPSDRRLDIQPSTQVKAGALGIERVDVPIEARVASGEVLVTFTLTSPTGVPIGNPEQADVTVRAEWEAIGLSILGAAIVLLLVWGVIRTVRRKREAAAKAAAADAVASPIDTKEEDA